MGVRNYLIEGVSGAGKTTVAEELQRRGRHVVHGDRELAYHGDPRTGEPLEGPTRDRAVDDAGWAHDHWIWNLDKVRSLVADQRHAQSFFCGGSRNLGRFIDLFDAVFVLEIDLDTLNRRLAARPADQFGGAPSERAFILRRFATREDLPKNAVSIDAAAPVARVVDEILAKCEAAERGAD